MDREYSTFKATLRLTGDGLIPEEITDIFGRLPSLSHRKGSENSKISKSGKVLKYAPFRENMWAYSVESKDNEGLDDCIKKILSIFPNEDLIHKLQKDGICFDLYCGWFISLNSQNGFEIDSKTLGDLARLQIKLGIEIFPMLGNANSKINKSE